MVWLELTIEVSGSEVSLATDTLLLAGAQSVSIISAGQDELYQLEPGDTPWWMVCRIVVFWPVALPTSSLKDSIKKYRMSVISANFIEGEDWVSKWQQEAVEQSYGTDFWILPKGARSLGRQAIYLDPGLAFGSGSHPTTSLCLEWICRQSWRGMRMLDFGCGSGVLSLAAAKLGASKVVALDHDSQALMATRDNAEFNNLDNKIEVCAELANRNILFDVVAANILLQPLLDLAPMIQSLIASNGVAVLSGVTTDQLEPLKTAYDDIVFDPPDIREGWICMVGRKKKVSPIS